MKVKFKARVDWQDAGQPATAMPGDEREVSDQLGQSFCDGGVAEECTSVALLPEQPAHSRRRAGVRG